MAIFDSLGELADSRTRANRKTSAREERRVRNLRSAEKPEELEPGGRIAEAMC